MKPSTMVIDIGLGNLYSVTNALDSIERAYKVSDTFDALRQSDSYVFPGVGCFSKAVRKLQKLQLFDPLISELTVAKKPYLGICLGMQLLASSSTEDGEHNGLGVVQATVDKIDSSNLVVPHVGWNYIQIKNSSPLFVDIVSEKSFYFDHSYHVLGNSKKQILATTNYGTDLVVAISQDNIFGVQFHPEKSQKNGLKLLKNYFQHVDTILS